MDPTIIARAAAIVLLAGTVLACAGELTGSHARIFSASGAR
jgi:hypothetical protein